FDSAVAMGGGRNHVILAARGGSIYTGEAEATQAFQLGGFLELSGLEPDQLLGQQLFLGRAILLRQMRRSLFLPSYLGMSLEAGEVWQDQNDVSLGDLRVAGSLFVGFDTILGPFYFGGGWAEGGDRAAYVRLGQTF
ncbi:MAG: patatin, partial [Gammaproteobacteria bacterium]